MKMHVLSGGRLRLKRRIYFPDADRAETIDVPVSCFLIRHRQGNVLFDSGCHPSVIDDAQARWGGNARVVVPIFSHDQDLIAELDGVGLWPDDIDVVVNSHLHFDHCGCNEFFKRRPPSSAMLASWRRPGPPNAAAMGYVPADWDHPMPIDAIDGQRDLYGDDRIVLIPLPGHTPGRSARSSISIAPARSCWPLTPSACAPTSTTTSSAQHLERGPARPHVPGDPSHRGRRRHGRVRPRRRRVAPAQEGRRRL